MLGLYISKDSRGSMTMISQLDLLDTYQYPHEQNAQRTQGYSWVMS